MKLSQYMDRGAKRLWIAFGFFLWTFLVFGFSVIVGLALAEKGISHSMESANGRYRAYVKSHITVSPPRQSLWLRDMRDGRERQLAGFSGEEDRVQEILWSAAADRLGCLTQASRLLVFAVEDGEKIFDENLDRSDRYPGNRCVKNLSFLPGGEGVRYDLYFRWKAGMISTAEALF